MAGPHAYDFSALGARTPRLLIIVGSDVDASARKQGGYHVGGNSDVYKLLPQGFAFDQLNLGKQFLKTQKQTDPTHYECVLNLVTDPDQHPHTLERLQKLLRGHRGRVINRPEAVLKTTRDQVARRLAGIDGLHVPKIVRLRPGKPEHVAQIIARAGLQFPLILRQAGMHTGKIVGVVGGIDELQTALTAAGDHFATEFVDLLGADGLYRKYRVYFFGDRVIYRNLYASDQWNVHSADHRRCLAARPQLVAQLQSMFTRPEGNFPEPVRQMFNCVRERMPVDFFGMDFGFRPDGQAVLFEANATMSFFPSWPDIQFRFCVGPAQAAFRQMLFPEN